MKKTLLFLLLSIQPLAASILCAATGTRVSVHDPSVVWQPTAKRYYIFGSHRATATSTDMINWTWSSFSWYGNASNAATFRTQQVKTVTKNGEEVEFPNFDATGWSGALGNYNIDGNLWAPDVIYNTAMRKWCMYMSVNGPTWNSSIVLLTSNSITGPYRYQGPVVVTGFNVNGNANVDYKKTDLEIALGTQKSLPSRYAAYWGRRWPHAIDPCVFYDEEGLLWMAYGSWSGGIWMLQLNAETGLRDYDVKYPIAGSGDNVTSDPYFGKRIAGGFYASGEGSYIEYIDGYYFLFVSNGGLAEGGKQDDYNFGGYQMRVFRSAKPDGPYRDRRGQPAVLGNYELNFGPNSSQRGVNIFGAYTDWGNQTIGDRGERSQGHNSIIAAPDGRIYLVYHTRFQTGGGFENRVHQCYLTKDKWLVAAPFEYSGEKVKTADISAKQIIATDKVPGVYKFLRHDYGLDHRKKEASTPVEINLNYDGTISGDLAGKWTIEEGTSYININCGGVAYKGVMIEQTLEPRTTRTPAFTVLAANGTTAWGYKSGTLPIPDALDEVSEQQTSHNQWYDLRGMSVKEPLKKGIYIKNGRKYVIKN